MNGREVLEPAPPLLELRQYLLRTGRRDELVALFDREFVETQESLGIRVVGQFLDIDRPNHFVWMRGFAHHAGRRRALTAFYGGPTWAAHGSAAADTMIDSDDVHQLRSADTATPLRVRTAAHRDDGGDAGAVVMVVAHRRVGADVDHDVVRPLLLPRLDAAGFTTIALLETDHAPNVFPRLPVRTSNVQVTIATADHVDRLDDAASAMAIVRRDVADHAKRGGEVLFDVLRLRPTNRSCLVHQPGNISSPSGPPR